MSIRVIAAAVAAATGLAIASGGPAMAARASGAARAVQLSGVQLLPALLPAADFPAGYAVEKTSVHDSGARLETAPAKFDLATMSCGRFANHFGDQGYGESAMAHDAIANHGQTKAFLQQVYQFKASKAATPFFNGLRAILHRCPDFPFQGSGSNPGFKLTWKLLTAPAIGGHWTFQFDLTAKPHGVTFALDLVFTVAGPDVFFTGTVDALSAPPASPSPRAIMLKLINRVRALR